MRAFLALVVVFLFAGIGSSSVEINPRPPDFSILSFLEKYNNDLSEYWRTYKFDQLTLSPFIFYRGTSQIWWRDWSNNAALADFGPPSTRIWVAGDLHIFNFGTFKDAHGDIVFEINDFDDGCPENYQHDVWRFATSVVLIARECNLSDSEIADLIHTFAESYRKTVKSYRGSGAPDPESVEFTEKTTSGVLQDFIKDVEEDDSTAKMLKKWTVINNEGKRVFNLNLSDLQVLSIEMRAVIANNIPYYISTLWGPLQNNFAYFAFKDVARRLDAGMGSLGRNRYYLLVEGPSSSADDDVILDIKEAKYPSAYLFATAEWRAQFDLWFPSPGFRHNTAYQAISRAVDYSLGNMHFKDGDDDMYLYVRSRSPWKESIPYCTDKDYSTASQINSILAWIGRIMATQHSRSDKRFNPQFVPWSFPKQFDEATGKDPSSFYDRVIEVAFLYADQVQADWEAFSCNWAAKC